MLKKGWEKKEVKNIFGSGMLTTKYPGAVSGTNSNKSFSKRTVVNSRYFFFFQLPISEKLKAPSAHGVQMALWTKRKRKNKGTQPFSLYFPLLLQTISKTEKTFDLK